MRSFKSVGYSLSKTVNGYSLHVGTTYSAGQIQCGTDPEVGFKAIQALYAARDLGQRPPVGADLSYNVQVEINNLLKPKTKLQHRKIFKNDATVSDHSKWHTVGERVGYREVCNHSDDEARDAIKNKGGIVDVGYALNMFREIPA